MSESHYFNLTEEQRHALRHYARSSTRPNVEGVAYTYPELFGGMSGLALDKALKVAQIINRYTDALLIIDDIVDAHELDYDDVWGVINNDFDAHIHALYK